MPARPDAVMTWYSHNRALNKPVLAHQEPGMAAGRLSVSPGRRPTELPASARGRGARQRACGCTPSSTNALHSRSSSPARMTTVVVPSPTCIG